MMPALQSALQTQNTTMEQIFPRYTEANYSLAYQKQADFRTVLQNPDDRPNPEVRTLTEQTLEVNGPIRNEGSIIQHLGATYIEFANNLTGSTGRGLSISATITVTNPSADPVVKIWAITQYTPTVMSTTITAAMLAQPVNSGKSYSIRAGVPNFDHYQWVAMAISNPQMSGSDLTYTYSAQVVPPTVIYAGGVSSSNSNNGVGWISRDTGASWTRYTFSGSGLVQATAAVPNTQGLVGYMATSDLKLWKTTDGGVTFPLAYDFAPKVQGVITNTHFSLITLDPTNNNTLYVGLRGKTDPFWGPDIGALFKSTDGGQTFGADLLANCHLNHNPGDWQDCAITSLAIDPQNPNVLWIGQDGWNALAQTLMRSSDGGATWHTMLTTISTFTAVSIPKASNHVVWALLQKQLDGQWVYYTTDTGATWHQAKVDSTGNPAHRTIAADPFDPSAAWVSAGEERLKHTADSNVSWQSLTNSEFHSVAVVESNLLIGAAAWPPGTASVQLSVDGGATWTAIGEATMYGAADSNNAQALSVVSR